METSNCSSCDSKDSTSQISVRWSEILPLDILQVDKYWRQARNICWTEAIGGTTRSRINFARQAESMNGVIGRFLLSRQRFKSRRASLKPAAFVFTSFSSCNIATICISDASEFQYNSSDDLVPGRDARFDTSRRASFSIPGMILILNLLHAFRSASEAPMACKVELESCNVNKGFNRSPPRNSLPSSTFVHRNDFERTENSPNKYKSRLSKYR
mmetsp:Transcript_39433/g.156569  ORF Transcript_39433/g.156569 Transcript_39433/m.156569 type:complete len:214 (+) Transcript_39433:3359-4000(+)